MTWPATGSTPTTLRAARPALVYCSITGFGQDGPYADRPGYDFIVQAMGGIMDLTGTPDGEGQKPGVAYADIFTGLYAVTAIQAALLQRARTGEGATIDLALLDTQVGRARQPGDEFPGVGQCATPHGQCTSQPGSLPGISRRRWRHGDRRGQRSRSSGSLCEVLGIPALAHEALCAHQCGSGAAIANG